LPSGKRYFFHESSPHKDHQFKYHTGQIKTIGPDALAEIRANRTSLSRVGAVFKGISAEMQPPTPRFFDSSVTA
jgi:hypothetical protein